MRQKQKKGTKKINKLKQNKEHKTHTHTHTHTPVNYVKKKRQNMYKYLRSFLI